MCTDRNGVRASGGFSLIEMIVFIVIVGVALAGVLSVLDLTVSRSADPMLTKQSLAVGEAFADEILSRDFTGNCGCAHVQANRSRFVGVGDYDNFASNGIFTRTGTAIPGLDNYSVAITVADAPASTAVGANPATQVPTNQMKIINVTVTDPAGRTYPVSAFKANF
jgi:MSHA pilin protein MshD